MKIDKSLFTADELATFEALVAKAKVDPEAAQEEMEEEIPEEPPVETEKAEGVEDAKKSADPDLTAALERLAVLEKSYEMKEYTEIAKKYAPLGEKEDELAETLYNMKKSNEANYNAFIDILDKSLGFVEKSGVFAEIGKSAPNASAGDAVAKVEAAAEELMKADSNLTYEQAIAKAWTPELIQEYEEEYKA